MSRLDLARFAPTNFIRIGHHPDDDPRTRRLKSMAAVIIIVVMGMTTAFFLEADRSALHRILDVSAFTSEAIALIILHRTKSTEALFLFFAPIIILIQTGFTLLNGNVEGDMIVYLITPAAAVVILGHERSRPWFLVCFVAILVVTVVEGFLPEVTWSLSETASNPTGLVFTAPTKRPIEIGEGLAMTIGVFFIYFLIYSGYQQLSDARRVIEDQKAELEREYLRSEGLLENILPTSIAERLKQQPDQIIADSHLQVTILFADIVDFTPRASTMSPQGLVEFLNEVFTEFDELADRYSLEKIKTIGDAYMVAGGMPDARPDHATAIADMALEMMAVTERMSAELGDQLRVRIGIHTGPAVAGVIGTRKFFYDVWGDTVNTASRMESHGVPGRIQVTAAAVEALGDDYVFEDRGPVEIKGKGTIDVQFLIGKRIDLTTEAEVDISTDR